MKIRVESFEERNSHTPLHVILAEKEKPLGSSPP